MKALHDSGLVREVPGQPITIGAGRTPSQVLYGSQHDGWQPAAPHEYQRSTIGSDPHAVRYAPDSTAPASVADIIANMVVRSTLT
jgi:hypothetical protein